MRELENKRQKDIERVAADAERQLQLARADADRSGDKAAIAKAQKRLSH